jgi:hypothetical protein
MALPGVSQLIQDGGLGVVTPATSTAHVIGDCESGALNTPTVIANQTQLSAIFGRNGAAVEAAGNILNFSGGPLVMTRTATSVAATYGGGATDNMVSDLTPGVDNEINLAVATSAPKDDYEIVVNIIVGGALAATTFQYSLDGGQTFSPTLPAAASVVLGDSGVTLEFEAGATAAYVAGASYTGSSKGPIYNATDLSGAFTAINLSPLPFDFYVFAGEQATAAASVLIFSAVATQLTGDASSRDRYLRAIMGAGDESAATALAAFNAVSSERICVSYGNRRKSPAFSGVGRAAPRLPALNRVAALAAANEMSTDLAKTFGASTVGVDPGVSSTSLSHNEFTQNAGLHDAKIGTMRTYTNLQGAFVTSAPLKSGVGSDFTDWQFGRIIDEACKVVSIQHTNILNSAVEVKADGSGQITEVAAQGIEKRVQRALDNVIGASLRQVGPTNVEGGIGHASEVSYQVDRTTNVLSTKVVTATVSIVPFGYAKQITTTLSFALAV